MAEAMIEIAPGVAVLGVEGHEHREGARCTADCPHHGSGYRVWPDEWPQDAAAIRDEVQRIRWALTKLRGEISDLGRIVNDMDLERELADARGCVQGAIVLLYSEVKRCETRIKLRAGVDARLPLAGGESNG